MTFFIQNPYNNLEKKNFFSFELKEKVMEYNKKLKFKTT